MFCEVKARSSVAFGTPAEAVTVRKRARVRRLAAVWLGEQFGGQGGRIRFDVAAVIGGQVEILEGAF